MITRFIVLIAALTLLSGCGHTDETQSNPTTNVEHEALPADSHCQAVARQRANDARANGYSLQIEDSVFSEAYQDCVAQRAKIPD